MYPNVPPKKQQPSLFEEVCLKLTPEEMTGSIRLHRRKHVNVHPGRDIHGNQESSSYGAMDSPGS
jgi:hypothetical protein